MNDKYIENSAIFKILSDANRLRILDMLSNGELCACNILDELNVTQPTLSHHMKVLCDVGLVNVRKDSKWMYYTLNREKLSELTDFLNKINK